MCHHNGQEAAYAPREEHVCNMGLTWPSMVQTQAEKGMIILVPLRYRKYQDFDEIVHWCEIDKSIRPWGHLMK